MGRGARNTGAAAVRAGPRPKAPRRELEEVLEVAGALIAERVEALIGEEDINPALIVRTGAGETQLIELAGLAEIDPVWAMEVAIPGLLEDLGPVAVAFISDAWESDPTSPAGRREVAIVAGLDDQGIASASRGEITRMPNGTCQLGRIETASPAMAQGLMEPLIRGLGLRR